MTRLASLTLVYVVIASLLFAAISASPLELWAFPVVVSLWTAYVWLLGQRGIRAWSTPPRPPGRVTAIIAACTVIALIALGASIAAGFAVAASVTAR
jgi:hypothetical protein